MNNNLAYMTESESETCDISVGGWKFEDVCINLDKKHFNRQEVVNDVLPLIDSSASSYYSGIVYGPHDDGPYKAFCTLSPLDLFTAHGMYINSDGQQYDEVFVFNTHGKFIKTFKRTRYRACCNPVITQINGVNYIIINTNCEELSVYDLPDGKKICTIKAPQMMTAILPDKTTMDVLHLFGWVWHPHEVYYKVNLREKILAADTMNVY